MTYTPCHISTYVYIIYVYMYIYIYANHHHHHHHHLIIVMFFHLHINVIIPYQSSLICGSSLLFCYSYIAVRTVLLSLLVLVINTYFGNIYVYIYIIHYTVYILYTIYIHTCHVGCFQQLGAPHSIIPKSTISGFSL